MIKVKIHQDHSGPAAPGKVWSVQLWMLCRWWLRRFQAQIYQGSPTHSPWATLRPRMSMNAAQHKIVNLLTTLWDFFVITCHNVFNVWPKTTLLLPVWPRDAKRLDSSCRPFNPHKDHGWDVLLFPVYHSVCIFPAKVLFVCFLFLITSWCCLVSSVCLNMWSLGLTSAPRRENQCETCLCESIYPIALLCSCCLTLCSGRILLNPTCPALLTGAFW